MWTYTTGAQVYASPSVTDGLVFIPSWDGRLYTINEYSGQLKWSFTTGAPIYASPAVSNGVVYLGGRDGYLYALNEQTGVLLWQKSYPPPLPFFSITSSPLVANGKVFYGNWCSGGSCPRAGYFEAIDASTGALLWLNSTFATGAVISSPSIDNGLVFFGETDGTVLALNETNGMASWSVNPVGNVVVSTAPTVAYGRVYVGTNTRFVALNEQTGATVWTFNNNNANTTSAAVNGGIVYFGTGRGNIYALNATTGAQKWVSTTGAGVTSSPALALGSSSLLVGSNDHYLYSLDMATGIRLWRYPTGGSVSSSPAVADGRVFFGSQDSGVYALGVKAPQLHVSIVSGKTVLRPGDISNLTMTVTNGTSLVSANVTLTSTAGGGFSPPQRQSLGVYTSNYTAPLINTPTTTTIQSVASATGFLEGTGQTVITLNPFPTLIVYLSARPPTITPGGDILLMIMVQNGSQPILGASMSLFSNQGGTFSSVIDSGNGNYTVTFSSAIQSSSPTLTVQASKTGFTAGQSQVTVTVSGIPNLVNAKILGLPVLLIALVAVVLFFAIFMAAVAKRRKEPDRSAPYVPNYALPMPGRLI
jgi:outer membrane protein assembly factor BamB